MPWWRRILELVAFAGLGLALFLAWPATLGGPVSYTTVSGHSMDPTMHFGDLAVLRAGHGYHVGEIVAFRIPAGQVGGGALVIHRIVGGDGVNGFTTQGDNNPYVDSWHPRSSDVVGRRWALLPAALNPFDRLHNPLPLASLLAVLAAAGAYGCCAPRRRRSPSNVLETCQHP